MRRAIGLREIRKLKPGQKIWDTKVLGFHARCQAGSGVSYVLFYRTAEGRTRWHTIGRHGSPWTPDTARDEAQRLLGQVASGSDPAADKRAKRVSATVSELCHLYLADIEAGRTLTRRRKPKKESTLATDRGRIERHIKPLLGTLKVASVTREDIEGFLHDVSAGKTARKTRTNKKRGLANVRGGIGTASRTVGLLGSIFTYAVRRRMRADNPVHGVTRPADGRRDRRLSEAEYATFGKALRQAEEANVWPAAVEATRFLALTGWRRGEALQLRWDEIDLARRTATLADTKTGLSVRPLSHAACEVLESLTRTGQLVFPATRGPRPMAGFPKLWMRIAKFADLSTEITPHTLRHSFASLAADLGYSEPTIAAPIGHKGHSITSRYVHTADAVLLAAADEVANRTADLMGDTQAVCQVIELPKRATR
jgi:integrase